MRAVARGGARQRGVWVQAGRRRRGGRGHGQGGLDKGAVLRQGGGVDRRARLCRAGLRHPVPASERAGRGTSAKIASSCHAFALRMLKLGSAQQSPGHRAPDAQPDRAWGGGGYRLPGGRQRQASGGLTQSRMASAWPSAGRPGIPVPCSRFGGPPLRRRPPQTWCDMPNLFGVVVEPGRLDGCLHGPLGGRLARSPASSLCPSCSSFQST